MQRRYDRIITIQRKTDTQSSSGEPTPTWADLAFRTSAHVAPVKGDERSAEAQEIAEQETTITVRFHAIPSASRPLTPKDRIIYPAHDVSANTQSPPAGRVYDILGVDEVGREVDLKIRASRRADV
jgi:SPP1 family predicted phage head-tail adaptor